MSIACNQCYGLCCTVLYFAKSEGFPFDKPAGETCVHLNPEHRCLIHEQPAYLKMTGCQAYDCLGAGQLAARIIDEKTPWRTDVNMVERVQKHFLRIYRLHQMRWYLLECSAILPVKMMKPTIELLISENIQMAQLRPNKLSDCTIENHRIKVNRVLQQAGTYVRKAIGAISGNKTAKDYMGKIFKNKNVIGKNFCMALLIAANLEECDLAGSDFLGADLRNTNLRGADLSESIFLSQGQINTALGDDKTKLPPFISRPKSWSQ